MDNVNNTNNLSYQLNHAAHSITTKKDETYKFNEDEFTHTGRYEYPYKLAKGNIRVTIGVDDTPHLDDVIEYMPLECVEENTKSTDPFFKRHTAPWNETPDSAFTKFYDLIKIFDKYCYTCHAYEFFASFIAATTDEEKEEALDELREYFDGEYLNLLTSNNWEEFLSDVLDYMGIPNTMVRSLSDNTYLLYAHPDKLHVEGLSDKTEKEIHDMLRSYARQIEQAVEGEVYYVSVTALDIPEDADPEYAEELNKGDTYRGAKIEVIYQDSCGGFFGDDFSYNGLSEYAEQFVNEAIQATKEHRQNLINQQQRDLFESTQQETAA